MFIFSLICLFLFGLYGFLILYYWRVWQVMPDYRFRPAGNEGDTVFSPGVRISVLVPARDEEKHIQRCLQSLGEQDYPKEWFEVIVIDDHSTDRTWELVSNYRHPEMRHRGFQLASRQEPVLQAHKKRAIEAGVGLAEGELIVATDADCWFHPGWLQAIASFYKTTGAKFIAAPVRIGGERTSGATLLRIFQTLDFITLQGITAAAVDRKIHSMCNGANLAYEKKVFEEVGGFSGIDGIPSGDDMLLMHKIFLKYPGKVFYLKNKSAIVSTQPEKSWRGFIHQRIRWASKADRYDDKRIFWVLLLVYFMNLVFAGLLIAAVWNRWFLFLLLLLLAVKTLIEYPFVRSVAKFFGQEKWMVYFGVLQPFHILYTIVIGWLGKFGSYRWKGRKVKR